MNTPHTIGRVCPGWACPARADLWILATLALIVVLSVQGYVYPRTLVWHHHRNVPLDHKAPYCSGMRSTLGDIHFGDPIGYCKSSHWWIEVTSQGGGVRAEYNVSVGHRELYKDEPMPPPAESSLRLSEPWHAVDEETIGGGCVVETVRLGWGKFAAHAEGERRTHLTGERLEQRAPSGDCRQGEYWASAPIWSLAMPPMLLLLARTNKRRRVFLRARHGFCIGCGYDLRASGDRCPECGLPRGP